MQCGCKMVSKSNRMKKIRMSGKMRDGSRFEVPVYQDGQKFKSGKFQTRAGFINGHEEPKLYHCSTVRIEKTDDLTNLLKKYGTVELHPTIYSNIAYSISLKRNRASHIV